MSLLDHRRVGAGTGTGTGWGPRSAVVENDTGLDFPLLLA